jgi:hypothetical protein
MRLKLYNNSLLVPLKCGTRYLDTIFNDESISFDTRGFKHHLFISNVSDIVVRPPIEHLTSALHTAILTFHNHPQTNNDVQIDLTNIVDEFCLYNKKTDVQNTHWRGDLYETLYWLWRRNRNNINIIELKDLSLYLEKLNIKNIPKYDSKDYDFHNHKYWCSKDEIMHFIKTNYTYQWENLMEQIKSADIYYNALINKELIEIKLV